MPVKKILVFIAVVLLLLPNFLDKEVNPVLSYNQKEKFNPALARLNSINSLEIYVDSIATAKHITPGSFEYVSLMEEVIEERFYHGFSHYTLNENWIAALAGGLIKEDYACKVQPEEIMKHPNAACSQQALVMMQLLRNKGISYRSVGFPHHYAMEVWVDNEWYFFDANMEPDLSREQRMLSYWQHQNDKLKQLYDPHMHAYLDFQFGNNETAIVGAINEIPAQKAKRFHIATGIASKLSWLLPFVLLFTGLRRTIKSPLARFHFRKRKDPVVLPA